MKKHNLLFRLILSDENTVDTGIYSMATTIKKQNKCSNAKALQEAKRIITSLQKMKPEKLRSNPLEAKFYDEYDAFADNDGYGPPSLAVVRKADVPSIPIKIMNLSTGEIYPKEKV
jgi:hypothetical protein